MNVNVQPSIDTPLFLRPDSEVDYIFYVITFGLLFILLLFLFFRRLKKSFRLLKIKRDIKLKKIKLKDAAYCISEIINNIDLSTIKSLTNQNIVDIRLLKYKQNHKPKESVVLKILDKLILFTLFGKY